MSVDRKKLEALLKWYKQEVGENLIATLIVNREGLVMSALKGSDDADVEEDVIGGVSALVEPVLTRITEEFSSGSFGTGTFDTEEQRFIFGFIDGCHQQSYVENDFHVIWPRLVSGGALGFHDYKFDDWPEITKAVEKLIHDHKREIREAYEIEGKYNILSLLLIKK